MPYYEIQAADLQDGEKILSWSQSLIGAATRQAARKKK